MSLALSIPESWDRYQYLLLMGGCLAITLPLQLVLRARVYSRPRRLFAALAPVVVVYSVWDIVGIARDHWWYSPRFTTGWRVPFTPMPVEELVFFIVIPICGLLTYGAVGFCLRLLAAWRSGGSSKGAVAQADADETSPAIHEHRTTARERLPAERA